MEQKDRKRCLVQYSTNCIRKFEICASILLGAVGVSAGTLFINRYYLFAEQIFRKLTGTFHPFAQLYPVLILCSILLVLAGCVFLLWVLFAPGFILSEMNEGLNDEPRRTIRLRKRKIKSYKAGLSLILTGVVLFITLHLITVAVVYV